MAEMDGQDEQEIQTHAGAVRCARALYRGNVSQPQSEPELRSAAFRLQNWANGRRSRHFQLLPATVLQPKGCAPLNKSRPHHLATPSLIFRKRMLALASWLTDRATAIL